MLHCQYIVQKHDTLVLTTVVLLLFVENCHKLSFEERVRIYLDQLTTICLRVLQLEVTCETCVSMFQAQNNHLYSSTSAFDHVGDG